MSLEAVNNTLKTMTGVNGTITDSLKNTIVGIRETYTAIDNRGGLVPAQKNADNLADAIASIVEGANL